MAWYLWLAASYFGVGFVLASVAALSMWGNGGNSGMVFFLILFGWPVIAVNFILEGFSPYQK